MQTYGPFGEFLSLSTLSFQYHVFDNVFAAKDFAMSGVSKALKTKKQNLRTE